MPVITKIAPEGGLIGQAESPRERDRLAERPQSVEKGQVRDEFRCRAGSEGANVDGCAERRQQWHGAPGYRGWATNEDREPSRLSPGEAADNGCVEQSVPAGRTGARRVTAAGPNRGHLDHGQRCARAGGDAVGAFGDGPERGRVGHHGDQRVCLTGRLRRRCHCAGTQLDQRCRAGWGPVPDDRLVSRSQQPGGAARSPQGRRPAACWCASAAP